MSPFRAARTIDGIAHVFGSLLVGALVLVALPYVIGGACVVFGLWIVLGLIVGIFRGSR